MSEDTAELFDRLQRYRVLLRATPDARAKKALTDMIAEIEARLAQATPTRE